ncbi:methionyl-tRNA formyltransferase [Paracidovorax valerianellae]|uniref:Methionyl-tRNA formyltransferase n=1 Tax=Paracidovorax valerianellae TaxID=187868 RepID=A0A1G6RUJ4_9BURK|nr:methionyl-tRNA formyltransferase [Paracidovorax valerianellae]MDA8446003.1 methionyl-tRNA formyltransferase [Paracidovorax valerianellae]SDD08111.1 methionyl-tRNA formyltransferase [Paracidovorax valerianellae]
MKIIFAGTPDFARVALQRLLDAGFTVPLVLTQPDRPAGRGMKLQASPVKQCALEHGIAVAQPRSLRLDGKFPEDAAAARDALIAAGADAMVVAAYGLILPQWVLDWMSAARPPEGAKAPPGGSEPRAAGSVGARGLGCLNIHASLLPRWRGAAPIHRAIEAGDAETGVTIMQMDAGLDTGDMLLVEKTAIGPTDTTAALHDRLADLGGRMIVEALELAACGGLTATPQPAEGVTYAHKIEKAESAIDWALPAEAIGRRIRAFDPFPGASTTLDGEAIKVWSYEIDSALPPDSLRPGHILSVSDQGVTVACGDGGLRLTTLQRAGGKRLPVADFLRGFALAPGMVLGSTASAGAQE